MLNDSDNLFNSLTEGEKISIVDQVLNLPACPIPRETIPFLTKEHKLDLFDKLVGGGAIKYTPYQQNKESNTETAFAEHRAGEHSPDSEIHSVQDYTKSYSIIGTDLNEDNIDIAISNKARLQTTYIIGASGSGKSTLVANLVISDCKSGGGVAVLDPHGDLIKTIIAALPENRVKDVIYLNIEDVDHPYGLNLYECQCLTIRDMAKTASFVSHAFEKIWGVGTDTPRLMQNLRAVTRTLIENPGTTF
nr:ATP-binding protein [Pseudomonadota bacterium]